MASPSYNDDFKERLRAILSNPLVPHEENVSVDTAKKYKKMVIHVNWDCYSHDAESIKKCITRFYEYIGRCRNRYLLDYVLRRTSQLHQSPRVDCEWFTALAAVLAGDYWTSMIIDDDVTVTGNFSMLESILGKTYVDGVKERINHL